MIEFKRIFRTYYILNLILVLIYPVSRYFYVYGSSFGDTRETTIFYMLILLSITKYIKRYSLEHFFSELFFYSKIALICIYYFNQTIYALWYTFACVFLWLFVKQPKYNGPTKQKKLKNKQQLLEFLNLKEFQKINKKQETSKRTTYYKTDMKLVEFYADFASICINTKPIWANYSLKYTTKQLKFGEIDVQKNPNIAKEFDINTSGMSNQLPTLILFENGVEVDRFPHIDPNTKKVNHKVKYDGVGLAKYFDLEARYLETRDL